MKYVVKFERVGRNKNVPDLELEDMHNASDLEEAIFLHVRPMLVSRDVQVVVPRKPGAVPVRGMIYAGLHMGGEFTVQRAA